MPSDADGHIVVIEPVVRDVRCRRTSLWTRGGALAPVAPGPRRNCYTIRRS
ncbi:hypothetical protein SBD_0318 [Streptomyces bottropensis ATCC 25435]|uniref:Uncharacterized protein n=1 Tax=Streptomyces bottropensis ATCC 25435 TaxID=1054862 RepID=M3EMF9_9ACTN|nr:hypothetical protein SBD_0318 [Streptomyces bottropensis ATCC 25435]